MPEADDIKSRVEAQVASGDFLRRLAERIGAVPQASAVFGEPVERDGLTVIRSRRRPGASAGVVARRLESSVLGGGGGGSISPLGYIEVRDTGAEFKAIRDPSLFAAGAAAMGVAVLAARAFSRR